MEKRGDETMKKRTSTVETKVLLLRSCLKPTHLYELAKEGRYYYSLRKCALELVTVGLIEMSIKVKKVKHRLSPEPQEITQRMFTTTEQGRVALEAGERFLALLNGKGLECATKLCDKDGQASAVNH